MPSPLCRCDRKQRRDRRGRFLKRPAHRCVLWKVMRADFHRVLTDMGFTMTEVKAGPRFYPARFR